MRAQNIVIILGSTINMTRGGEGRGDLYEHENLNFDNEHDTHMSSKTMMNVATNLALDLLTILF